MEKSMVEKLNRDGHHNRSLERRWNDDSEIQELELGHPDRDTSSSFLSCIA